MTENEKQDILQHKAKGLKLTHIQKNILLASLKNGEPDILNTAGDSLCCDLGIDAPDRYKWTTFDDCSQLGGRAADNSDCGH